jgi:hypothetical protein
MPVSFFMSARDAVIYCGHYPGTAVSTALTVRSNAHQFKSAMAVADMDEDAIY